ncbi:hypothetical protein [Caulobacter sp.]|uniref:hypothetical protein n=1 Tax=Caulobacter sp. TaxID=78 RepID=UPI001B148DE6|nr:hypothetical protein [Caulobacter sp.]MBO9546903.1 hypothetical protein [Caulobacter sp.]
MELKAIIIAVFVTAIGGVFRSEIEAWLPHLANRLTRIALRQYSAPLRDRLSEEWEAHLSFVPGPLSKVFVALEFCRAACIMKLETYASRWRAKLAVQLFVTILKISTTFANGFANLMSRANKRKNKRINIVGYTFIIIPFIYTGLISHLIVEQCAKINFIPGDRWDEEDREILLFLKKLQKQGLKAFR